MFDVRITGERDIGLHFEGATFTADSDGTLNVFIPELEKERLYRAIDAQQAWETGDHVTEYTKGAAA